MPAQFVVPQFIDVEDKIIGPITTRQFVLLLVPLLLSTLFWKIFSFTLFIILTVPMMMVFGLLAFAKINGMPVHFFILNLLQSFRRPRLRIWDKTMTNEELLQRVKKEEAPPPPPAPSKAPLSSSRLHELTLVVNTGGVYRPEEE